MDDQNKKSSLESLEFSGLLLSSRMMGLPTQDLPSGFRVYLTWHLQIGPCSVSSQVCWQPPLPWLQVTTEHQQETILRQFHQPLGEWGGLFYYFVSFTVSVVYNDRLSGCVGADLLIRTDATSLVLGQLKAWPTLARHSTLGSLFADVGTAMFLVHAAQALWANKRWTRWFNDVGLTLGWSMYWIFLQNNSIR